MQLKMRGGGGRGELDDRHGVDEAFWARAAADQAANRESEDLDASKYNHSFRYSRLIVCSFQRKVAVQYHSTRSSSMMTLTMDLDSMTFMMVMVERPVLLQTKKNRIYWLPRKVKHGACDQSLSITRNVPSA